MPCFICYFIHFIPYILSNWFRISFVGSGDLIFGNAEYLFAYDDKKCPVQNRKQVTGLSKIQLRNFKNLLKTSPGSEEPVKKTSAWVSYSNVATNTLHVCWQHSITNTDQQLPLTQDMKNLLDYFLLSIQALQCWEIFTSIGSSVHAPSPLSKH